MTWKTELSEAGADVRNHETGTANGTIKQATCHPAVNGAVHNKHSVSNSDETVFKVSVFGLVATVFLVWLCPQYYYIIYSLEAIVLLSHRYRFYKRYKNHYFFLDFCYYETLLVFIYLWLPCCNTFRAALFPVVFAFSHGPILGSVVLWRNSIVLHSVDKMTNIVLHVSPAVTLWGIRWFSTNEQGFPLCANPSSPGPRGCGHVGGTDLLYTPMQTFLIWQTIYIAVVFFLREERIKQRSYNNSFLHLVEVTNNKKGLLYPLCWAFGPRYRKLLFVVWHFIYTLLSLLISYPCFHSQTASVVLVSVMLLIASYNGATYYRDVYNRHSI